jgi:predicted lactoylglutathione lyase
MLGRFLEISVEVSDVLASLQFYAALGFQEVPVNETWAHPYAVVTDGRLFLGLHQRQVNSPTISYVHAEVAKHARDLSLLGVKFDYEQLSGEHFNTLGFRDPNGVHLRVLEARTFSPPSIATDFSSTCGYFVELGLPVKEFSSAHQFWERLGFVAWDESNDPFHRMPLTSDHLNIGLHRSRALRHPILVFEAADMEARLTQLKERGLELSDEMPDALDASSNAVLIAPEGTRLLLLQSTE